MNTASHSLNRYANYLQETLMKKLLILFLFPLMPAWVHSQEIVTSQPREEGVYANLFTFKFLPGKSDEGGELLKDVLLPAFKEAGIRVTVMEDLMGTKDIFMLIELEEGPGYYASLVPQQDIKLWNALVKVHGNEIHAEEKVDKFISFIQEQSQTLVFLPEIK